MAEGNNPVGGINYHGGLDENNKINNIKSLAQENQSQWVTGYVEWALTQAKPVDSASLVLNIGKLAHNGVNINYGSIVEKLGDKAEYLSAFINDELKNDNNNFINDELKNDNNNFIDEIAKKNPSQLFELMSKEHTYDPAKKDRLYQRIKAVNPKYKEENPELLQLGARYDVPEIRKNFTDIEQKTSVMGYLIEKRIHLTSNLVKNTERLQEWGKRGLDLVDSKSGNNIGVIEAIGAPIIEDRERLIKANKTSQEEIEILQKYFPQPPKYNEESSLYKVLIGSDLSVEYIATKIREAEKKKEDNGKEIDFIEVMYNSHPDLALKIKEIAKEVEVQKGSSYRGIKDSLIKLKETFSHIRKGGIKDKALDEAFSSLTKKDKVIRINVGIEAPIPSRTNPITRMIEVVKGNSSKTHHGKVVNRQGVGKNDKSRG